MMNSEFHTSFHLKKKIIYNTLNDNELAHGRFFFLSDVASVEFDL